MRLRRVTFSLLLPILELTLWFVLVPSQSGFVYFRLRQMAHGATVVHLQFGKFTLVVPQKRFLFYSIESVAMRESHVMTSVNMPGMAGEILLSLPVSWPDSWHPSSQPLFAWRSLVLPFFCLPAWWFAGHGLDGLLEWRHPHWWTLLIGVLLCAGLLTLLIGLRFGLPAEDRIDGNWIFLGFAFWTVTFGVFPVAWVRRVFHDRNRPALPDAT